MLDLLLHLPTSTSQALPASQLSLPCTLVVDFLNQGQNQVYKDSMRHQLQLISLLKFNMKCQFFPSRFNISIFWMLKTKCIKTNVNAKSVTTYFSSQFHYEMSISFHQDLKFSIFWMLKILCYSFPLENN